MQTSRRYTVVVWMATILVVGSLPWVVRGMWRLQNDSTGFVQWMPENRPAKRDYDQFIRQFGGDDLLLVSWPGCGLDDPRSACLADDLLHVGEASGDGDAGDALIRDVYTAAALVEEMTSDPLDLPRQQALARLRGVLLGEDGREAALLVRLTDAGRRNQRAVVNLVLRAAVERCGVAAADVRMGGTVFEATAMEIEMERTVHDYLLPISLATLITAWFFLRNIWQVMVVLLLAFYCRCASMALVYYMGHKLSMVLSVMPVLVYVLAVSGGIHLVNYYRDVPHHVGPGEAASRALRAGWLPCTLAVATTMIGMMSLLVSSIVPVQRFGMYAAAAMFLSLLVLLTVLPPALRMGWFAERPGEARRTRHRGKLNHRLARRLAAFTCRWPVWILAAAVPLIAVCAWGLGRLTTSVHVERMFSARSDLLRNYRWIEEHIGPVASLEVVIAYDDGCLPDPLERVTLTSRVERRLADLARVGGTLSTASFLPAVPSARGLRQTARRGVYRGKFQRGKTALIDKGYLSVYEGGESWRVTARVPALGQHDYGRLLEQVRQTTESVIAEQTGGNHPGMRTTYTGLVPLMQEAQRQVMRDLANSLLLATLLICPVMMGILRSFWSGLLAMIPNLFPLVVIFGVLGWLGKPIDVGIMLTASIALGIAVDDTLHFLTWFARGLRDGLPRGEAIRHAYRKCSGAMVETTLICGFGLLPLTMIEFVPTSEFALLLLIILLVALVGDLILLPAMLASPLGALFVPRRLKAA